MNRWGGLLLVLLGCGDNTSGPLTLPDAARLVDAMALDATTSCSDGASCPGRVFVDRDNDGVFSDGDTLAAGVKVFFETGLSVTTNSSGEYSLPARDRDGIVWVRSTDQMAPGPHWQLVPAGPEFSVDIAVPENTFDGPFSFVVASDTHAGIKAMSVEDQILALTQSQSQLNLPSFIAVTGDITQPNKPEHFALIQQAIDSTGVTFVPIPGNHDWYDGGVAYREHFGPPSYSFDSGGTHFVVLNDGTPVNDAQENERAEFLAMTIAAIQDDRDVVVLMHAPPYQEFLDRLLLLDIDILLTGHMHTNRTIDHGNFVEYNTQPFAMGGVDRTPAGYRVLTKRESGGFDIVHKHVVNAPFETLLSPAINNHVSPSCQARVIVSAKGQSPITQVRAQIETLGEVSLVQKSDWTYTSGELPLCIDGQFQVDVEIFYQDNTIKNLGGTIEIGDSDPIETGEWAMHQGGKAHLGQAEWPHPMPEFTRWVTTVSGSINSGSPIVADGRIFMSVSDFGAGTKGGIVALDPDNGETLWEFTTGFSVRNASAAAQGKIMFISQDGTLHCLDAATGQVQWQYELALNSPANERIMYSSPTIDGDTVIAGGGHELVVIEIASGEIVWSVDEPYSGTSYDPWASYASPTVGNNVVVIPVNRKGGLFAFDRELGTRLWQTGYEPVLGVQGSPLIVDGIVYVVNELLKVTALDVVTGEVQWSRLPVGGTFGWGYFSGGTPAVGAGKLFLPSLRGELIAIDLATGVWQWTHQGNDSNVRLTHYDGQSGALSTAPIWVDGKVWTAGSDGILRVLDADTGVELWQHDIGSPLTSSPTISGDLVIVSTLGGTVHALSYR
ncbi:MAG: PQQ-binding-like beta-propeller repeat protein [Kofleriaceae bacterium]|nr:PQQ-binding-like beta-propeller repeat protein [Kofleriaceae bacterium]